MAITTPEDSARALWLAVVLQAKEDNFDPPHRRADYSEAVSFLTSGGAWGRSRADVANACGMDPDLLDRMGREWVGERRVADGNTYDLPVPQPKPAPIRPAPKPRQPPVVIELPPLPEPPRILPTVHPAPNKYSRFYMADPRK